MDCSLGCAGDVRAGFLRTQGRPRFVSFGGCSLPAQISAPKALVVASRIVTVVILIARLSTSSIRSNSVLCQLSPWTRSARHDSMRYVGHKAKWGARNDHSFFSRAKCHVDLVACCGSPRDCWLRYPRGTKPFRLAGPERSSHDLAGPFRDGDVGRRIERVVFNSLWW